MNPQRRHPALFFVAILAGGLLAVASVTGTPQAAPAGQESSAALDAAAELARDGDFDAAEKAYEALIDGEVDDERLGARLGLAQLLAADGRLNEAVDELDAYLLEAPVEADVADAQYLLARALALQTDWTSALPLYDAYIASGGGAALYAELERVWVLANLGQTDEAITETDRLLTASMPASARRGFFLIMAATLEELEPQAAIDLYQRLQNESDAPDDQARALWRSAQIDDGAGPTALAGAWTTIIQRFPETETAAAIIDEPPEGVALDTYYTGLVYFHAARPEPARDALEASLSANAGVDDATAARAAYHIASLDDRAGDRDAAIDGYSEALEFDSTVEFADDALRSRARLLEEAGRDGEAASSYETIVQEHGGSDWAPEARFRLALLDYDADRYDSAADQFASIAGASDGLERTRALLWLGKTHDAAGDDTAAEATWRSLAEEAVGDYYGLRAAVLVGDAGGELPSIATDSTQEPDWSAIAAWLGVASTPEASGPVANPHWRLGQELLALGIADRADAEFRLVLETRGGDTASLYELLRGFREEHLDHLAAIAATRLLDAQAARADDAPDDLWRLAYPAAFGDVLRRTADNWGVPDLLLLALVRQESFYDPDALSPADARGLTQVIPSTGEAIASELGLTDFDARDLERPALSLTFGAHHLSDQIDAFDGNVYHGLAAYNAGPDNTKRWADAAGEDIDRFVAEIDFTETHAYVRLVSEHLARYRQLYEGLEAPELPRD